LESIQAGSDHTIEVNIYLLLIYCFRGHKLLLFTQEGVVLTEELFLPLLMEKFLIKIMTSLVEPNFQE
jgi:hypothetical protein